MSVDGYMTVSDFLSGGSDTLYNFNSGNYEGKPTWAETIGVAAPAIPSPASESSYNQFTADNISNFFKDIVGSAASLYTAKAAVDIARVKAQTGLNIAKVQGIYPQAAAQAYNNRSYSTLILWGTIGLIGFVALRK